MSLLRLSSAVVLVPGLPLPRLRHISFVIAAISPLPFRHQGFPVANHRFHHHIEDGGQHWVALDDAYLSAEGFSVLPSCLCHHLQPIPVPVEEVNGPRPNAISLQDIQALGPVQVIVSLVQFHEDCMDYRLLQGRNLLDQIDLEGVGLRCSIFFKTLDIFLLPAGQDSILIAQHLL